MQITVTGVSAERTNAVMSMLGERRLALLMNAYKDDHYRVEVHEHGVLLVIATVQVVTKRETLTYETWSRGLSIADLVARCDCPEHHFGAKRGYRLAVACKHALFLHAFKSRRAAQQVCTLIDLLYPGDEEENNANHRG